MMNELKTQRGKLILVLILAAAVSRFLPHPPNFTPLGAMALFGGTFLVNKRTALILPLAAMLLSDIVLQLVSGIGFHRTIVFVYLSFVLITSLGFLLRQRVQRQTIMVASLVGSLIFFFVTNFGVWITQPETYPLSSEGLFQCYIAGIPFFKGTVMGDLFYNLILFGSHALLKNKFKSTAVF